MSNRRSHPAASHPPHPHSPASIRRLPLPSGPTHPAPIAADCWFPSPGPYFPHPPCSPLMPFALTSLGGI